MAKIPIILEPGRADGKLIKTNSVYDDNQEKFLSDKIKEIDNNHNTLKDNVNTLTEVVNNNESDIETKLETEKTRATNAENNLRETINNITNINEHATTAELITVNTLPNTSSSNVQQALDTLYKNSLCIGIATPTTDPGTIDGPVFYLATEAGIYTNFNNIEVIEGETAILSWNNSIWEKKTTGIATEQEVIYDVSVRNGGIFFESLSALLSSSDLSILIPTSVRRGGMTIRFVQSSDNKYVQYRLMSQNFTTDITKWQGVDNKPITKSDNLVKSGGVKDAISLLEDKIIEFSDSIQDLKDNNLYITDKNGYIIAKIDSNGIESVEVTAKGKKLSEQETVTSADIIQDLYQSELYITDVNGYVVAKIDKTGINCIGINVNNLFKNQWNKKNIATYGDSVTALNGGNYSYPYSTEATNAKWGGKVAKYFNFANIYNRGIGSTTFNYYSTHGGQVAWCRTNTGEYVDRNDSYNYDNYEGQVTIPSDCTPIRGCGSSWLRITTMFPNNIKDTIDVVLVMFHNDFHQDMDTECAWVEGSNYDKEWKASEYYKDYGGDYNIETVRGGIASTYMKLQAWMPQALIVLMSPISGVYVNGNDDVMDLENTESAKMKKLAETVKDIAFRLSIPFIDVYGTDCINSLNKKLRNYITDGIHPYSDAGCKVIARAIISSLHSLVPYLNY